MTKLGETEKKLHMNVKATPENTLELALTHIDDAIDMIQDPDYDKETLESCVIPFLSEAKDFIEAHIRLESKKET